MLRPLKREDAAGMLEWMKSPSVVEFLSANFAEKTLDDCTSFIEESCLDSENVHMAIVDENDEYMGTVSLKHMNSQSAEFAIVIRQKAMGQGFSKTAMRDIIQIAFNEYGLEYVYWCVSSLNKRAVKFYDKNGYCRVSREELGEIKGYTDCQIKEYIWYKENNDGGNRICK